jgi:splicing factor 3A subunit 1
MCALSAFTRATIALTFSSHHVAVIDRTAAFVAKSANPPQFEDKIRENQRNDPKFSFLNPADPYHAYYRNRMQKVVSGEDLDTAAPTDDAAKPEEKLVEREAVDVGKEPPAPEFLLDLPNMSGIDLCVHTVCLTYNPLIWGCRDIMKLTALFTARRGRAFLATLSLKEGRNYQFDFLRPTHSLFVYFNRLVEQYAKVISPDKAMLEQLKERNQASAKWKTLEDARAHAKWERNKREKDRMREDEKEAERSTCIHRTPQPDMLLTTSKKQSLSRKLTGTTTLSSRPSSSQPPTPPRNSLRL